MDIRQFDAALATINRYRLTCDRTWAQLRDDMTRAGCALSDQVLRTLLIKGRRGVLPQVRTQYKITKFADVIAPALRHAEAQSARTFHPTSADSAKA